MPEHRRKPGKHSSVESFSVKSSSPDGSSEDVMLTSRDEESNNEKYPLSISRKRPLSSSSEYSQNNTRSPALSSTPPRSISDYLTRNDIEYSDWDIDRDDNNMTRIHDNMSCNSEVSTELSDDD